MRRLTPRQQQIAEMAGLGWSNRRIARTLKLSEGAVKLCLNRIYKKRGFSSRYDLIREQLQKSVTKVTDSPLPALQP